MWNPRPDAWGPWYSPVDFDKGQDISNALALEKALYRRQVDWIDPPSDSDPCLCPKHYPRFWA